MANHTTKPRSLGVLPVVREEIDEFEGVIQRYRAGQMEPTPFRAYRLHRGVYGQRQPDTQMVRIKIPFGGLTADQLEGLGTVARDYTRLQRGHITTRQN